MGLRFNKRIKICKGVSVNLGKKGASLSVGTRGARVTVGKNGVRKTIGIPGTGISYTDYKKHENSKNETVYKNKIQYPLPEGVVIPQYKFKFTALFIGIVCLILSFVNILFLLPAFVSFLVQLFIMAFSKGFRNAFYTQSAMLNFKKGNWDKCTWFANKALKIDENNESSKKLIDEVNKINVASTV